MKKKIVLISAILLFLYLCFRYMGLLIFWMVTPGDGELRPAEKILFEQIKKESKAIHISREPKYYISNPKDTTTYRIIIRKKELKELKEIRNVDSLKSEATKISKKIDKLLNLNEKFINYEIIYEYLGYKDESFKFKRSEIANSKK
jgi:hypothetical protein